MDFEFTTSNILKVSMIFFLLVCFFMLMDIQIRQIRIRRQWQKRIWQVRHDAFVLAECSHVTIISRIEDPPSIVVEFIDNSKLKGPVSLDFSEPHPDTASLLKKVESDKPMKFEFIQHGYAGSNPLQHTSYLHLVE